MTWRQQVNSKQHRHKLLMHLKCLKNSLVIDNPPPVPPKHQEQQHSEFLKFVHVYEKRMFQSHTGLDFHNIMNRFKNHDTISIDNTPEGLEKSVHRLEAETEQEIQKLLEYKTQQELNAQQTLDALVKEIEKSEAEAEQQRQILMDLQGKLGEVNRQYELKDMIDQELDDLSQKLETLASTFQTECVARIHAIVFEKVIFSSSAHFGTDVNTLNRLFIDANRQDWGLLLNKQMAKCYEEHKNYSEQEGIVQEFKELLHEVGLYCGSESQEALLRECVKSASRLRRFAIVRYPQFPARARTHYEKKMKIRNSEHVKGQSWVQKFKKLTEK